MKCVIDLLDWEKAFTNTSFYKKVAIFKETINGAQLNQRFPVPVRLLAMCRGEPSAVIARLILK